MLGFLLAASPAALAQNEVSLIAPGGDRAAIEAMIPGFEAKSGIKVKATFGSGLGTKKQVADGDAFDVFVVQPPYPAVLASGNVDVKSHKTLASVAVGVVVKQGAPKPDISTPDAVKKLLLSAKSVTYPDPKGGAAAGVSFEKTLDQLGITDQVKAKIKRANGGAGAMELVAKGDVEVGLTFLSEMGTPGIEVLGPLPRAISSPHGAGRICLGACQKSPGGPEASGLSFLVRRGEDLQILRHAAGRLIGSAFTAP